LNDNLYFYVKETLNRYVFRTDFKFSRDNAFLMKQNIQEIIPNTSTTTTKFWCHNLFGTDWSVPLLLKLVSPNRLLTLIVYTYPHLTSIKIILLYVVQYALLAICNRIWFLSPSPYIYIYIYTYIHTYIYIHRLLMVTKASAIPFLEPQFLQNLGHHYY